MEIQHKKHVRVICDLEIGDTVTVDGFSPAVNGIDHVIEDILFNMRGCESAFLVKISGYDRYLDSSWLIKK